MYRRKRLVVSGDPKKFVRQYCDLGTKFSNARVDAPEPAKYSGNGGACRRKDKAPLNRVLMGSYGKRWRWSRKLERMGSLAIS